MTFSHLSVIDTSNMTGEESWRKCLHDYVSHNSEHGGIEAFRCEIEDDLRIDLEERHQVQDYRIRQWPAPGAGTP